MISERDASSVLDCFLMKSADKYAVARQNAVNGIAMLAEIRMIPELKTRQIINSVIETLSLDEDEDVRRNSICIICRFAQTSKIPESMILSVMKLLTNKLDDSYNLVKTWACMAISFICRTRECDKSLIVRCVEIVLSLVDDDYRAIEALCSFVEADQLGNESLEQQAVVVISAANSLGDLFYQEGYSTQRKLEINSWLAIAMEKFRAKGKVRLLDVQYLLFSVMFLHDHRRYWLSLKECQC